MRRGLLLFCVVSLFACAAAAQAPLLNATERGRAKKMLNEIKDTLRKEYYDKTFHGLDLNRHFKTAETKLDSAVSLGHAYAIIAQALIDLNDSHTFFIPPNRTASFEYGWKMQVVGDQCFVVAVKADSDAAAQGLKPGDRVLQYDAFVPQRDQLWKAEYLTHVLSPRRVLKVVVQSPGGAPRALEIAAKVTPRPREEIVTVDLSHGGSFSYATGPRIETSRAARIGDLTIWKLGTFGFNPEDVDSMFDQVIEGAASLVLDLRGNPGGLVKTLEQFVGRLFDRDVKIADVEGRKSSKPSVAKTHGRTFTGKLVLLVDSGSASAAEVLARVVQIEKRGTVVGDRTSGSVMQGVHHRFALEVPDNRDVVMILYGASITDADLILSDGHSLERVGVTPDEVVLPTAEDLRAGRDPALSRAAAIVGGAIDPQHAGAIFPVEWK